jgi:hypothetical protein
LNIFGQGQEQVRTGRIVIPDVQNFSRSAIVRHIDGETMRLVQFFQNRARLPADKIPVDMSVAGVRHIP